MRPRVALIETSLAHPAHPVAAPSGDLEHVGDVAARVLRGSTRHLTTDARFAAILEEDFGIAAAEILRALEGEPRRQAIEICAWAQKTQEPAKALANWAKKHRKGSYAPRCRCADCGGRFRGRDVVRVGPEQAEHSYTAFEGELFCRPCARRYGVL